MRRPWRGWSAQQLLSFVIETVVLALAIMWLGAADGSPGVIQVVATTAGATILLVGALVGLGWVRARRCIS